MRYTISVLVSFALVLTFAPMADAQAKIFEFTPKDFGVGGGFLFGEEGDTFDQNSLFGALDSYLVKIPVAEGSSGVSLEFSFPSDVAQGTYLQYKLWNLNRAGVPGTNGKIYGGADFKFAEGGTGAQEDSMDFDTRFVVGARMGNVGGGVLYLEAFADEEDRPISARFVYAF